MAAVVSLAQRGKLVVPATTSTHATYDSTRTLRLPMLLEMAVCRVCGVECAPSELRPVQEGGGCRTCNGSPACARCGHARRHHRGTFGGGVAACTVEVPAEQGLAFGRCGCSGYTADAAAFEEPVEIVDVVELRLRVAGESPTDQPALPRVARAKDLFDRPLARSSERGDVPWRPAS